MTLHDDELPLDVDLVRRLLAEQQPDLADLPLAPLPASGSSNRLFRLGEDLLVRLPRQPGGGGTVVKEQHWVPVVAPHLPVPTPRVVRSGRPGCGYPEAWSVVTWLPGEVPTPPRSSATLARDLGSFVASLHAAPVPAEAVVDPALRWYRGGPLADVLDETREFAEQCRRLEVDLDVDRCLAVVERASAVRRTGEGWYHGDLLAENLLVEATADGDRLAGVLDLGGLGVGLPATDHLVAWELLDAADRATYREVAGVDDEEWLVGAGWSAMLALATVPYYRLTMPARCEARLVGARAVLAELTPEP